MLPWQRRASLPTPKSSGSPSGFDAGRVSGSSISYHSLAERERERCLPSRQPGHEYECTVRPYEAGQHVACDADADDDHDAEADMEQNKGMQM
uniref:Uncharacterized protein n=1 Tax=Oryza nivara TaxID=4536 RepID=A0A0E0HRR3_ORYNI